MIANSLHRHQLAWFFALAFGISWGGILLKATARWFHLSPLQSAEGGLICTAFTGGRAGLALGLVILWALGLILKWGPDLDAAAVERALNA